MFLKDPLLEWVFPNLDQNWIEEISKEFSLDPVSSRILANKGFSTLKQINRFLYSMLPNLHNPDLFSGMKPAVE